MTPDTPGERAWAERWDRLYDALSAEPRREVIISLLEAPPEQGLPLPDAAVSPNQTVDPDTLAVQLRHHHLPVLSDGGYVDWDRDAFVVERGPNFAEPAFVVDTLLQARAEMPTSLTDKCRVLREMECEG
ncbi:hypothetical protein [Halovivax cerinus]|uniref:Transcriptional regulator n=1 Tax=Halovivax cerinus TaxID=1487865 RepID=A0ABD5NRV2_9EURY|nr:hypothetical protein [Halovivax cerinus]